MPELRQNLATKDWVILATERARRPEDFKTDRPKRADLPPFSPNCPFCPGNEGMSPTPNFVLGDGKWRVRIVNNKFPALVPKAAAMNGRGPYRSLPGEGIHEVIVESPSHNTPIALMEDQQVGDLVSTYLDRFNTALKNPKVALTILFKNHGEGAGTSLEHPHSQLIGASIVPTNIRHRMDEAMKYYEANNVCVFCKMVQEELRSGERMILETEHFVAFILFAALSPFHMWVMPKRHVPSFQETTPSEQEDFARILRMLLKKIYVGLGNPDFNYVIQSTPLDRGTPECFHWYLTLVLRTTKAAGFELGSGMYINTALPEESAKFLRVQASF